MVKAKQGTFGGTWNLTRYDPKESRSTYVDSREDTGITGVDSGITAIAGIDSGVSYGVSCGCGSGVSNGSNSGESGRVDTRVSSWVDTGVSSRVANLGEAGDGRVSEAGYLSLSGDAGQSGGKNNLEQVGLWWSGVA